MLNLRTVDFGTGKIDGFEWNDGLQELLEDQVKIGWEEEPDELLRGMVVIADVTVEAILTWHLVDGQEWPDLIVTFPESGRTRRYRRVEDGFSYKPMRVGGPYVAHFQGQAWVTWDCTKYIREGHNQDYFVDLDEHLFHDVAFLDEDDVLKDDPEAPKWIRDFQGPFTIMVTYAD